MAVSSSSSTLDPFITNAEKHEYSEIKASDDEEAEFYIPRARQSSRLRTVLSYVLKLVIVAMAVYGLIAMGISAAVRFQKAAMPPCNCGSSIAEALALGCKYDSLSTSWLPPHCRDDEMTSLFEKSGPGLNGEWNYYASNLNTSKVFTLEEMALMAEKPDSERQAWATIEWHDKHCFFTLLKQVRGRAKMQYTRWPSAVQENRLLFQ